MGSEGSRGYLRTMLSRDDGQILPGLVVLLLAVLVLGVVFFQVGKASFLRSQAQTAADAAALAGVKEIQRQLEAQWATMGTTSVAAIDRGRVLAEMQKYARKNEGELVREDLNIQAADVKAWTRSVRESDGRKGSRDLEATARARARVELWAAPEASGQNGSTFPAASGGAVPHVTSAEWEALGRKLGPKPRDCPDIITLGVFLVNHGFMVWQNDDPRLGGDAGHEDRPWSRHHDCNDKGALDVNFGPGGNLVPVELAALDPIEGPLRQLGYNTIWKDGGEHDNHMHVDLGFSAAGGGSGGGGFTGPLEDAQLGIRLIDWETPVEEMALSGYPTSSNLGGPPDPQIANLMCSMAGPYGHKILLATFETAIVESGVHNLDHGMDASHGVFQQQWTVGAWGTLADTMNPPKATRMFLDALLPIARRYPGWTAGQWAAEVQQPREDLRYKYDAVASQAEALIAKMC
jgi:cell division protein FtsB